MFHISIVYTLISYFQFLYHANQDKFYNLQNMIDTVLGPFSRSVATSREVSIDIPNNLIFNTFGQIYPSPDCFQKGPLPAIDREKPASNVEGKYRSPHATAWNVTIWTSSSRFRALKPFTEPITRTNKRIPATPSKEESGPHLPTVMQGSTERN